MEKIGIFSPLLGNMMDIIVSDFDKSLQGLQIYVCAKFGCSSPDRLDRGFQADRAFMYHSKIFILLKNPNLTFLELFSSDLRFNLLSGHHQTATRGAEEH